VHIVSRTQLHESYNVKSNRNDVGHEMVKLFLYMDFRELIIKA